MVEHWPFKPLVSGSSPDALTKKYARAKLHSGEGGIEPASLSLKPRILAIELFPFLLLEYSQAARHRSLEPTSKVRVLLFQINCTQARNSTVECSFDRRDVDSSSLSVPTYYCLETAPQNLRKRARITTVAYVAHGCTGRTPRLILSFLVFI